MRDRQARDREPSDTLEDVSAHSDIREITRSPWAIGAFVAGRYELLSRLGIGGSGEVFGARDLERDAPVAIKLLHRHLRASNGHVARFSREVRALSTVAHSAIVRVLDAGEDDDGTLYLVMELLEGELLHDRIGEGRIEDGLAPRDVLELGRQLLSALAAAHARGIVHRDIKPENLFLTRAPSGAVRLKVLDFGIAKVVQPDRAISFQTLDGLILGTPDYMSPEVCRGMPVTAAADLWAAAAVLFHALAGRPPFEERHVGKLLLRIVRERAPSLATLRADLSPHLIEAIDRALDPDPERRFPTAEAFATALAESAPIHDLDWD